MKNKVMKVSEVEKVLAGCKQASQAGANDGTRIHVHYTAMRKSPVTSTANQEAKRAKELGLDRDRFTGRVNRVWKAKDGSTILGVFVELERDHKYRSLNVSNGQIHNLVVLGD